MSDNPAVIKEGAKITPEIALLLAENILTSAWNQYAERGSMPMELTLHMADGFMRLAEMQHLLGNETP